MKTGVVLLNMGGPDSLGAVKHFLYNLFSDPDIIRLPFSEVFQKPLAWYISTTREKEAQENYAVMGGSSPQLPYTRQQSAALQEELKQQGLDLPVYIAMRYWHPFTEEAVDAMIQDGITHLVAVSLYPHFSYTTTGSSVKELKRVLAERAPQIQLAVAPEYYLHPDYMAALAATIQEGLDAYQWDCDKDAVHLLFSAHSLPIKHVKRTGDPYPEQIFECAKAIIRQYFPNNPWDIVYQSKVGNMPWLGPATDSGLTYLAAQNAKNVLAIPISFVSEHVETLVEIDHLYLPLARELGVTHCHRAAAINLQPRYIQCLSRLVQDQLSEWQSPQPEAATAALG